MTGSNDFMTSFSQSAFTDKKNKKDECNGITVTIAGTKQPDDIFGTAEDDVINVFEKDDIVNSLLGNDTICGGSGIDQLSGGEGDDKCMIDLDDIAFNCDGIFKKNNMFLNCVVISD